MSKKMTPALTAQRKRLVYIAAKRKFAAHHYANVTSGVQEIIRRADAAEMAAWRKCCLNPLVWPSYSPVLPEWMAIISRR